MSRPGLPRLLVVNDEHANVRALCETLSMNGYETRGAGDGFEALAELEKGAFDLLLTDLRMPGMDGVELVRAAVARDPSLVAIVMTGHGSIANAVQAMQSGALDYVLKPFKLAAALPVLARALGVRKLRMENAALEVQLRKQMADLVAANGDLDAFSYSVSHDLRAPLQVIDGFSAALERSCAGRLDDREMRQLARIRAGVERMASLISGLLRLSRLSRQPVERESVDVGQLVRDVLQDLAQEGAPGADRVVVGNLAPAHADPILLRQVFANLLSNACKFTSGQADARIEVGSEQAGAGTAYFVRDNGAGFDMARASKLFEPFHRMHGAAEFPGLGVGLSIVQRIVTRHGGHIQAESAVGKGACFRFMLDAPPASQEE